MVARKLLHECARTVACVYAAPVRYTHHPATELPRPRTPEAPAETVLTKTEIEILDRMGVTPKPSAKPTVTDYLIAIAKLGGYLARAKDPPPGNIVLWRGLSRLTDIHLGFELKNQVVGN